MRDLLPPTLAFGLVAAVVMWLRSWELAVLRRNQRCFSLRFPRELAADGVTTFIAGLSGVRPPWYWRWLRLPVVTVEARAGQSGISHRLLVPKPLTGIVLTHLRAALPGVRLGEPAAPEVVGWTAAVELGLSANHRPLRTNNLGAVSAAVLGSLQPLRSGEQVVVQWTICPARLPRPVRLPGAGDHSVPDLGVAGEYELLPHTEALKARRAKQAEPLFLAVGRVGAVTGERPRAKYLLRRVLGAYHLLNDPGVELRRRSPVPSGWAGARLRKVTVPLVVWPALLNAAEVAGVIGWPLEASQLPGLPLGASRQLPPSVDIPSAGCVVGTATYPGSRRAVAISPADRLLHLLATGPTGVGKSTLLLSLIEQDMRAGRSVIVVDPKGDLVADALRRVPPERVRDVIVLDPADDERPVGFNLLATDQASAELVAEQVVFVFHQLFSAFWGPRTDDVLRASLLTLMREPGMTLVEIPLLLTNPSFRRRFVAQVSADTVGLGPFWQWYDALSAAERAQVIAPLMNKLRATLLRTRLRYCIGQDDPGLQLESVLQRPTLLFVPLRKGVLGDEAAALLGSLFVARTWQAVQARSAVPEAERHPVHLYIDEVQDYLRLPTSVGDMLAQARGLKLGLTVAHQHLGQLTTELRADLLANCRSKIVFQTSAKDARSFEQELRPYVTTDDLQGLDRFEAIAQLAAGQRVAPPVTIETLPPPPETHRSQAAIAWSRQHYGRDRAVIEAAMRARHATTDDTPVGRRPRRGQP